LERSEGKARTLEAEQAVLDEKRISRTQEIKNDKEKPRHIRHRIEGLSAFVHRHDEAQLKRDRERLQGERMEARDRVSAQLPRDIVLLLTSSPA